MNITNNCLYEGSILVFDARNKSIINDVTITVKESTLSQLIEDADIGSDEKEELEAENSELSEKIDSLEDDINMKEEAFEDLRSFINDSFNEFLNIIENEEYCSEVMIEELSKAIKENNQKFIKEY
jgi:hypothetical protein